MKYPQQLIRHGIFDVHIAVLVVKTLFWVHCHLLQLKYTHHDNIDPWPQIQISVSSAVHYE